MAKRKTLSSNNETGLAQLDDEQKECIRFLAEGNRVEEAAVTFRIDPTIISTWMRDPSFLAAYNVAQRDIYDSGIRKLRWLQERALDVLQQALDGDDLKLAMTAALQVTRINVAMGQPVGEIDAEAIEIEQQRILKERVFARMTW